MKQLLPIVICIGSIHTFASTTTELCFKNTDTLPHTVTKVELEATDWDPANPQEQWTGVTINPGDTVCKTQIVAYQRLSKGIDDGVNFFFDNDVTTYARVYSAANAFHRFSGYVLDVGSNDGENQIYTYLMGDWKGTANDYQNIKTIIGAEYDDSNNKSTFYLADYRNVPNGNYKKACKIRSFRDGVIKAECLWDPNNYASGFRYQELDYANLCAPNSKILIRSWGDSRGGGAGTLYCEVPATSVSGSKLGQVPAKSADNFTTNDKLRKSNSKIPSAQAGILPWGTSGIKSLFK